MTTKLQRLSQEAYTACNDRGHTMRRWVYSTVNGRVQADSTCKQCGLDVQVLLAPLPNQIDIGGPAVAINCTRGVYR